MAVVANCWYFHRSLSHHRMDFSLDGRDTHVMLSSIIYFKSKIKKQPEIKTRSLCGPVLHLSSSTDALFVRSESGSSVDIIQSSSSCLVWAVTDTGGNFWGTGAEEASGSPAAGLDPTPRGPRVDTGPSEEEARLREDKNAAVKERYLRLNI